MRLCARGDQQESGVSFQESDLYAPVLQATEARLLLELAAAEGAKVVKTDTKQAYLYGDMGDDVVYLRKWSNKCSPRATDSWCFFIILPSERFQR